MHTACQSIRLAECESAIVASTNLFIGPEMTLAMDRFGTLASDGRTMTFDVDAHGYGRAEAVNAVYIKRLGAALRDGNAIRALVRSTSTNALVLLGVG